jgi:hypothetical protein
MSHTHRQHTLACITEIGGRLVCKEGVKVTRGTYKPYRLVIGHGTSVAPARTGKSDAAVRLLNERGPIHGHRRVDRSHPGATYHLPPPAEDRARFGADLKASRDAAAAMSKAELLKFLNSRGIESGLHGLSRESLAIQAANFKLEEWWPES